MRLKATIVHINALVRVTPLVGGYLKSYALAEPEIRNNWDIELFSTYLTTPASEIIQYLVGSDSDVVCFSVYTWNVGLVMRLLTALRGVLPASTRFLLGGVEVMNSANRLLDPRWDNVSVCNGEGERTFRDFLLQVSAEYYDPEQIIGLSFLNDGHWCSTASAPRIKDLSEIPSPWLNDIFDPMDMKEVALFETNRGCPFACEFCFWGGATGEKVNKVELDRIKDELTYMAERGTKSVDICDANFGMLKRDVEIAEHLVKLNQRFNAPYRMMYSCAKNSPERVEEIARIFTRAGMLHNQSISIQSLNEKALSLAKRSNIKRETYLRLQSRLNEWDVPSYIELIWPMPGETLDSFKDGVDELCNMGAQSFTIYPLLWLNNVGYADKHDEYGIATLPEDDPIGGGIVVIKTREVSFEDYINGLLFSMAVYLLHNCRGLYTTTIILNALGIASFQQVFNDFVEMMNRDDVDDDISAIWQRGRSRFEIVSKYLWQGKIADTVLHGSRSDFDQRLYKFMSEHPEWTSEEKQPHAKLLNAAFEFDLLNRPYPYMQTPFDVGMSLEHLKVHERRRGIWVVDSPFNFPTIVKGLRVHGEVDPQYLQEQSVRLTINHRCRQVFRMPNKTEEEHNLHIQQAIREIGSLEPMYEAAAV